MPDPIILNGIYYDEPVDVFVGPAKPSQDLFKPVSNPTAGQDQAKPDGGLWTSQLHSGEYPYRLPWGDFVAINEASKEWSIRPNNPGLPLPWQTPWFILVPNTSVRLFVIDSRQDLDQLLARFGRVGHPPYGSEAYYSQADRGAPIDFESLSRFYDGLHLTERGLTETARQAQGIDALLGSWDIPSTLWLKWSFKIVRVLSDHGVPITASTHAEIERLRAEYMARDALRHAYYARRHAVMDAALALDKGEPGAEQLLEQAPRLDVEHFQRLYFECVQVVHSLSRKVAELPATSPISDIKNIDFTILLETLGATPEWFERLMLIDSSHYQLPEFQQAARSVQYLGEQVRELSEASHLQTPDALQALTSMTEAFQQIVNPSRCKSFDDGLRLLKTAMQAFAIFKAAWAEQIENPAAKPVSREIKIAGSKAGDGDTPETHHTR